MSERQEGWYWVVVDEMWEVCLFKGGYWLHSGHDYDSTDDDMEQIGDYIPAPEEEVDA